MLVVVAVAVAEAAAVLAATVLAPAVGGPLTGKGVEVLAPDDASMEAVSCSAGSVSAINFLRAAWRRRNADSMSSMVISSSFVSPVENLYIGSLGPKTGSDGGGSWVIGLVSPVRRPEA